jgi:hypothetical protein
MHIIQHNPADDASPPWGAGRKVTETHQTLLWQVRHDDPTCPSRMGLPTIAETPGQIAVPLRPIHRVRKAWGLNRGQGRPRRARAQTNICVSGTSPPGEASAGVCRWASVGPWARPTAPL